jgi:hypothetical protein
VAQPFGRTLSGPARSQPALSEVIITTIHRSLRGFGAIEGWPVTTS